MPKAHSIYTVRSQLTSTGTLLYKMTKMTDDYEVQAVYDMVEGKGGAISCTCPAHKPWHKHCDILRAFQAEERVNSGYAYDFDRKAWIPPINTNPEDN
jgi:hypothetical protein